MFSTLHQLRHSEALPAWVRLAERKQAERTRRRQRRLEPLTGGLHPSSAAADEAVDRHTVATQVRTALATIRDSDRRLLELRYLADWSISELADALGLSEGAIRK